MNKRRFKDLTIKDAFMFAAVMTDAEECRKLLSVALSMKVLEVRVMTEKTLNYHADYHAVRLDVLAVENETKRRFNVEMQVKSQYDIAKRSRYYHSQMDIDALETGCDYGNLPDTYVVFICDFDPFGRKKYKYVFQNTCIKTGDILDDGQITVFLSTVGINDHEESAELVNFLRYVKAPEHCENYTEDELIFSLKARIEAIKRDRNWEGKFMLLKEMMKEERDEGRLEGEERINRLIQLLAEQNRTDDIVKSAKNKEFQEKLLKEFGL